MSFRSGERWRSQGAVTVGRGRGTRIAPGGGRGGADLGRHSLLVGSMDVPLAALVDALGGYLEVVSSPRGDDVPISLPVIHDGDPQQQLATNDLVLAVGVDSDSERAFELVRAAGAAGVSGVVLRCEGAVPEPVSRTANEAGVALLVVPRGTSWGRLFTLVVTALEAARAGIWSSRTGVAVGDLVQLANAIAGTVGGATTIEDPDSNVLAFSSLGHPIDNARRETILGHRVPGDWRQALEDGGVLNRLYGTDDVVLVDDVGERGNKLTPRMAIAVRAGGEVLGSVWVAQADRPFDDEAAQALRGAARIAALHMLHHRSAGDLDRHRRSEQMRALLSGDPLPAPGLSVLGLAAGTPLTVLAVAPDLDGAPEPEVAIGRLVAVVSLYAEVYRRRASAVAVDGTVYVILPAVDEQNRNRLTAFAGELVSRGSATVKAPVRVGIGSTAADPGGVLVSRLEADDVLRVLPRLRRAGPVVHIDDVRGHVALMHICDIAAQSPHLQAGRLRRLVEHDVRHDTRYVETLRAYLEWFGDVPRAAQSLAIHRNTFRYRLTRLVEISGLDLQDPDERLITHLQMRVLSGRPTGLGRSSSRD